jgi:hypothetical protein
MEAIPLTPPPQQKLSQQRTRHQLKTWAFIAGFFALASIASAQKLDTAPNLEIGDKWTYKFTNTGDRREPYIFTRQAVEITSDSVWLHGETMNPDATDKKSVWRYDIKRADILEGFRWNENAANKRGSRNSDGLLKSDDFMKFPLEVGKKWEVKEVWSNGQGHTDWKAEVIAFEKIKTEAGEFDAFKIQYRGFWNRTVNGNYSDRAEIDRWYAPAAKRWVKSSYTDRNGGRLWNQNVTELVKWEPKASLPAVAVVPAPTLPTQTQPAQAPASAPMR